MSQGFDRRSFLTLGSITALAPVIGAGSGNAAADPRAAVDPATGFAAHLVAEKPGRAERILMEGLPVGNGRMGALVSGDVAHDVLALNEDTLWTGGANPSGEYGSDENMGNYQALAELALTVHQDRAAGDPTETSGSTADRDGVSQEDVSQYSRTLDLERAVVTTKYQLDGVEYQRSTFASHPDQVVVCHLTASEPGSYTGSVELSDGGGRTGANRESGDDFAMLTNSLTNGRKYGVHAIVRHSGGTTRVTEQGVGFVGCTELTIVIGAATDYVDDFTREYRTGVDPLPRAAGQAAAAAARPVADVLQRHQEDHASLFDRLELDLGSSSQQQRDTPTFERVRASQDVLDPELFTLYFQFARYLLIAASRPGSQPMNLQGLWNIRNDPPWSSDYHTDINVQMCYWLSDQANLSETTRPLIDMVESQVPAWREHTRRTVRRPSDNAPARGWTVRVSHNIDGGLGWEWLGTGNAWYCWHLWDHYLYTQDTAYLRQRAHPLLRETCEFLEDVLVDDGAGKLVVADGWSPEQAPGPYWRRTEVGYDEQGMRREDGVSFDQELAWDVFTNYLAAAETLGVDEEYRSTVTSLRDRLHLPEIGSWGQLQEWYTDKDDASNTHRHLSHLVGFCPGRRISPHRTPKLAAAVRTSLTARGVGPTGWSAAWGGACWARMGEPARAMEHLHNLLRPVDSSRDEIEMDGGGGVYPNLFDAHPPFQIDGNIGGAATMLAMLVQSEPGRIDLLPALPAEWPTGSLRGVRARGGFELDLQWRDGELTHVVVESTGGTSTTLHHRDVRRPVRLRPGQRRSFAFTG